MNQLVNELKFQNFFISFDKILNSIATSLLFNYEFSPPPPLPPPPPPPPHFLLHSNEDAVEFRYNLGIHLYIDESIIPNSILLSYEYNEKGFMAFKE
jgi:hypothetical protein